MLEKVLSLSWTKFSSRFNKKQKHLPTIEIAISEENAQGVQCMWAQFEVHSKMF